MVSPMHVEPAMRIVPLQVRELPAAMASVALSLKPVTMGLPIAVVAAMQIARGRGSRRSVVMVSTVLRASSVMMATPMPAAAAMKIAHTGYGIDLRRWCDLSSAGEVRDDFNTNSCDGCNGDCTRVDNVCGDAIVECTEQCDDGAGNALHPNFGGCEQDPGYDRICVFGPPAYCSGDIDVPDTNLAEALRDALNLAANEPIQFSPLLQSLDARNRNITDVTGQGCLLICDPLANRQQH